MMLNCDLGESFGAWTMPVDEEIMVYIDQANIACGFHAGDPVTMKNAIALAISHDVAIGAHPSYPDLQGFGRRSMAMKQEELAACLQYQIAAIDGLAKSENHNHQIAALSGLAIVGLSAPPRTTTTQSLLYPRSR